MEGMLRMVMTFGAIGLSIAALVVPIVGGIWLLSLVMEAVEGPKRAREQMSAKDAEAFGRSLTALEGRMKSLEAILDAEAPDWRKRHVLEEA